MKGAVLSLMVLLPDTVLPTLRCVEELPAFGIFPDRTSGIEFVEAACWEGLLVAVDDDAAGALTFGLEPREKTLRGLATLLFAAPSRNGACRLLTVPCFDGSGTSDVPSSSVWCPQTEETECDSPTWPSTCPYTSLRLVCSAWSWSGFMLESQLPCMSAMPGAPRPPPTASSSSTKVKDLESSRKSNQICLK